MIIRSNTLRQNPAYRPGNSRPIHLRRLLFTAGAMLACHTRVPEQAISRAPVPLPVHEAPVVSAWTPRPGTLSRDYLIENRARVITTADTGSIDDSTSLVIAVALRHVANGGVAGLLRDIVVSAPGAPAAPMPSVALPYAFSAPPAGPGRQYLPVGRPGVDPCTAGAHSVLGSVRDLLVVVPDTLRIGQEWADSGLFVTCRAGVSLETSSRRVFRLTGFEPRQEGGVLLVTRSATMELRGASVRGDDTTRVVGAGTSSAVYELDSASGEILGATGTGSFDVSVRGRVHSERARQTNTIRITRRAQLPR